ncbi:shikimate kinase [Dyadobacter jejuensis]|uniref:Shikimate kinase n=1 Tax=Dyadobacter jejuensis TaxID=1082580 RepID=A0A316AHL6_9BACT|nr:shikimate kinase [Dyadobacter jejuensis]PWJ56759.1 shikimate kinase [Dyadobacter jejuensis]
MKNIILVGMMSSGKTTVGKRLAARLGYQFIDLDQRIVALEGMEISDLFKTKGEAYFREVELRALLELKPEAGLVVATGGGTPCFFDNMTTIKSLGISVFLNIPAEVLAKRIEKHAKDDRPILSGAVSLLGTLEAKIRERSPFYAMADYTLEGEQPVDELVARIEKVLSQA